MAGPGRNAPCSCGSGQKRKRCCGEARGPGAADLARAFLSTQRRVAVMHLAGIDRHEFEELFDAVFDLPDRHLALQLRLPRVLPPVLEELRAAIAEDDHERFHRAVSPALASVDTSVVRADLVRTVLALRDRGELDANLAAAAVFDLTRSTVGLLRSSLCKALAVDAGAVRTPSGLLVAAG
ncbi:MAG: hypothetical protein ACRD0U_04510 [Acidimicrobiales bacterium]